jgi:drug/metabolite transporter (DMT)-like permease
MPNAPFDAGPPSGLRPKPQSTWSPRQMTKYLPFILFTVFTNAAAQVMLKYGMMNIGSAAFANANPFLKIVGIVFSPFVFLGLLTFVISMASHLFVLSKVDLSYAYPFLSLAYVVVAVATYFLFGEEMNASRIAGIALICFGTVFIAQSGGRVSGEGALAAAVDPSHNVKSEVSR